jgi:ATP-dependent protease ClpP protease subunit
MADQTTSPPTATTPTGTSKPAVKKTDWRRPDPNRAVEIFGKFTEQLGHNALSRIITLRSENSNPITIYINSFGGAVLILKFINGLLDCRDLDAKFCRTVSVAIGSAASAGAILLALGDYAYAYEHTFLYFHPVQSSELPDDCEDAAEALRSFERTQSEMANKLAKKIIGRVVFRYQKLKDKFNLRRKDIKPRELIHLRCFVDAICKEMTRKGDDLAEKAYESVLKVRMLIRKAVPHAITARSEARSDAKVLTNVIKHEISEYEKKKEVWRINEYGAVQIVNDYLTLRDYVLGEHRSTVFELLHTYGIDFLSERDRKRYHNLRKTEPEKAFGFLAKKAHPILEPLWYYTASLCRALFEGENELTVADAYWLGIIDEVIGTPLVGFGVVAEANSQNKLPQPATPQQTAASAPVPKSSPAQPS